jgi:hypothetical protein
MPAIISDPLTKDNHPAAGHAHDCWICPDCGGALIPVMLHVGGKGAVAHQTCPNTRCSFQASDLYMVRTFGLCGKAHA